MIAIWATIYNDMIESNLDISLILCSLGDLNEILGK